MYFEIVGPITDMETIAAGRSIRQLSRLRRQYGPGRWRKLKGIATVRIASPTSTVRAAPRVIFEHPCRVNL